MRPVNYCLLFLLATACFVGCTSLRDARETHLLSDARQIVSARMRMIQEHPEQAIPSLADIQAQHPILDAERVEPFEAAEHWYDSDAAEKIVLRQKQSSGGRRIVAYGNGVAAVVKE